MRGNPKEGDDVIRRIKTMAPTQKVIMLSLTLPKGERDSIGADDYVDKNTHSDDIIAAVDRLARQTN
jgi:DNA-binding response OmpR family regulator